LRSHIAILRRRYLNLILDGRKTIECRLTRIACAPYRRIQAGETIRLKESGGPIRAQAVAKKVRFYEALTPSRIRQIRDAYNGEILAPDEFWQDRLDCRYASLIWLDKIQKIAPYRLSRKGLKAWIICE
jgi:ASC-1-like (ASCH) protein